MKMFKRLFLFFVFIASVYQGDAQVTKTDTTKRTVARPVQPVKRVVVKKPKPIRTELSGGIKIASNGWGIFMDKGWVKSEEKMRDYLYDVNIVQVELTEKKDPKEYKKSNSLNGGDRMPNSYIFGKINNFYALKIGYGKRKMIAGKPEQGNISVHWVYMGGLSLGMQKPYYLQTSGGIIKYSDNKETFLNPRYIGGSAGFMKGINELQVIPGAYGKTALHFDFSGDKKTKWALETGMNVEYYSKKIEFMAMQEKYRPYLVDVYIAIQFGKRW